MIEKEKLRVVHDKNAENLFKSKFGFTTTLHFTRNQNKILSSLHFFPNQKNAISLL